MTYICQQYFEGHGDQIKEYTIGVEALGRSPDFDPKKDSIVRVEAHRLRRRLSEYYGAAGAAHAIRITIPNGQYTPQFMSQHGDGDRNGRSKSETQTGRETGAQTTVGVQPNVPPRAFPWRRTALVVAACAVAASLLFPLTRRKTIERSQPREEVWTGTSTEPVPPELRILTGYHGPSFADRQGHIWAEDAYFTGGRSAPLPQGRIIEGSPEPRLLRTQRSGSFRYNVPLGKGTYELHLYFAETEYGPGNSRGGAESSRTFHISINGTRRLQDFDPLAESGAPNRLHVRVFKDISPAADGKLHIEFLAATAPAFVNAIEVLPSPPGMIHPVRIIAQDRPVTDSEGRFWSADEYFSGGNLVMRRNSVLGAAERALYRGERYGHFVYHIPLATGRYRLTLHFAETWFGTPESHQPAAGSRLFNVFANGIALLQNFEIVQKAGGPNRPFIATFDDLQPNAQGVLCLEFVPIRNYAEVNAIEVVETE